MQEVIGVVPAAGSAERLGWLPCSKELLPLLRSAPRSAGDGGEAEPEPVCYGLLRAMSRAGIQRAYITIRNGKWDVPDHLGRGQRVGLALSYLVLDASPSPAHSIDAAYPFTADSIVALGFPDVLLRVDDPFDALLERWRESNADVVLGLFPPSPDYRTERVTVDEDGRVLAIDPVPTGEDDRPTWTLAVWGPAFGRYLHEAVEAWNRAASAAEVAEGAPEREDAPEAEGAPRESAPGELVLGNVLRSALEDGLTMAGVQASEEPFADVGHPDRLMAALRDAYGK